jgi:hypothetical protein
MKNVPDVFLNTSMNNVNKVIHVLKILIILEIISKISLDLGIGILPFAFELLLLNHNKVKVMIIKSVPHNTPK